MTLYIVLGIIAQYCYIIGNIEYAPAYVYLAEWLYMKIICGAILSCNVLDAKCIRTCQFLLLIGCVVHRQCSPLLVLQVHAHVHVQWLTD